MEIITVQEKQYYFSSDLKKSKNPNYYDGCGTSNHKFLSKYELEENIDYNYFIKNKVTDKYTVTKQKHRWTTLLISKNWVDDFAKACQEQKDVEPALLDLTGVKPFTNNKGKVYNVEIRGTRHYRGCYFLANDIAKVFEIKKLNTQITRKRSTNYIEGVHYRYFRSSEAICPKTGKLPPSGSIKQEKLFLTYLGLTNVLFSAKSPAARQFTDWACELVYTAHIGTSEQKLALTANLMGMTKDQVKHFFGTCTADIPGLYLIYLGTVGQLRKTFDIPAHYPDHMSVYKFGRSNNIAKRFQDHVRRFNKLKIHDIRMVYYCPIDKDRVVEAETDLKAHFIDYDMKLDHPTHTELAIFEDKGTRIKGLFGKLFQLYATDNIALMNRIKEVETENRTLQEKLDISNRHNEEIQQVHDRERVSYERERAETCEKIQVMQELHALKVQALEDKIKRRNRTIDKLSN